MSHPLFLKRANLLYYVLVWLFIAFFQFLILQFQFALSPQIAFLDSFVSNAVYAGMGLSFWYPCRYISLERKGLLSILLNHAIAAFMAALIWLGIIYLTLVKIAAAGADYQQFFLRSFPWRFFIGALFYFATLTEVPITQALMEHGMAGGPALALLLAGPALSLPNMLVLIKVMGFKKTMAFCAIIVVVATTTGLLYGHLA